MREYPRDTRRFRKGRVGGVGHRWQQRAIRFTGSITNRPMESIGYIPPAEAEANFYRQPLRQSMNNSSGAFPWRWSGTSRSARPIVASFFRIGGQVWNMREFLRKRNEAKKSGDNQPVL